MHPSELKVSPHGVYGGVCVANSLLETFCFEASQPQLKKFIMVDQSGGKGRVFVHPSLAEELFSPNDHNVDHTIEDTGGAGELPTESPRPKTEAAANARLLAFRKTVASAFSSLHALRDIRRVNATAPWPEAQASPEAPATSYSSGTKRVAVAVSGSGKEDTEDLDALLSSDDEDEEVTSTAHSSEEQSADESYWSEEEEQQRREGRQARKRSRSTEGEEEENERNSLKKEGLARKLKIKRTVKTLKNMIPGGSCLDAALVLEETILYVKILRDRINQLEATRFPNQP